MSLAWAWAWAHPGLGLGHEHWMFSGPCPPPRILEATSADWRSYAGGCTTLRRNYCPYCHYCTLMCGKTPCSRCCRRQGFIRAFRLGHSFVGRSVSRHRAYRDSIGQDISGWCTGESTELSPAGQGLLMVPSRVAAAAAHHTEKAHYPRAREPGTLKTTPHYSKPKDQM